MWEKDREEEEERKKMQSSGEGWIETLWIHYIILLVDTKLMKFGWHGGGSHL